MERSPKRMRMTLPSAPHPAAALLDQALHAYFTKRMAVKYRIRPQRPWNQMNALRRLNNEVVSVATHSDAGVYAFLPSDLQGIVRKFTPHPVSLLVKDALYVWKEVQRERRRWASDEEKRVAKAQHFREWKVREALFDWLYDRKNYSRTSERCGLASWEFIANDYDEIDERDSWYFY